MWRITEPDNFKLSKLFVCVFALVPPKLGWRLALNSIKFVAEHFIYTYLPHSSLPFVVYESMLSIHSFLFDSVEEE